MPDGMPAVLETHGQAPPTRAASRHRQGAVAPCSGTRSRPGESARLGASGRSAGRRMLRGAILVGKPLSQQESPPDWEGSDLVFLSGGGRI
jgi:hypothetical protein